MGPSCRVDREPPRLDRLGRVGRSHEAQVQDRPQGRVVLDRLMRRAILAEPDRVVRPDVGHGEALERRETHRGSHVVGELQERRAEHAEAAVRVHAVQDRAHPVLADAEVEVATRERVVRDGVGALDQRVRRGSEVGRAADELGHVDAMPWMHALELSRVACEPDAREVGEPALPAIGKPAGEHALELGRELGMRGAVRRRGAPPRRAVRLGTARALVHRLVDAVGHVEVLVGIPAVGLLGQADLLLAERCAVRLRGVLRVRRARRRCACAAR